MSFKKSKEQLKQEFEFSLGLVEECGKEVAKTDNLHHFATRIGYLDAALSSGKLTSEMAAKQAKDLYKAWKETNKGIDKEWVDTSTTAHPIGVL